MCEMELVSKYKIIRKIHKNIQHIFIADDITSNNRVVIKKIPKNNRYNRRRIDNEMHINKSLSHVNILKLIDVIEGKYYTYFIYPRIDHTISFDRCNTHFSIFHMLKLMLQVCDAIKYMHNKDIVHRDIKPANIIFNKVVAILIDFDLSQDLTLITDRINKCGTKDYMAPELMSNTSINFKLIDIYSFGKTLYHLLNNVNDIKYYKNETDELMDLINNMINIDPSKRPNITFVYDKFIEIIVSICVKKYI